jgi:sulfite exporter TauE/SafE
MLASIHPLGERARHNRWGVTVTAFVVGSAAGGVALGAALGALGQGVGVGGRPALVAAVTVTLIAAGADVAGRDRLWPTVRRQVNDEWMTEYRGWIYGMGFGFQLGLGLVTIVTSAAVHAVVMLAFLTGSATGGALVGLVFGLARALPVLALRGVDGPDRLFGFHRRFQALALPVRRGGAAVLVATAALGMAVGR